MSASVVIVGAGPTAVGVLERVVANAAELSAGRRLTVHLVDPFPAGGGRVWRADQSDLLWANSLAADITVLPDASVQTAGPTAEGTTLWQWVQRCAVLRPEGDPMGIEARRMQPTSFPSRPLVNAYLRWVLDQVVATGAEGHAPVEVSVHRTLATEVRSHAGRVRVGLASGGSLLADAVVLAQGHLGAHPDADERRMARRAAVADLVYVPTGYTADLDLARLPTGEEVLVRGAGLAFVDLVVLVTGRRGGRFERDASGRLHYRPSGREPILSVGSRRGVPYRAKLGYAWSGPPVPLQFFTLGAIDRTFGSRRRLDLRNDLAPVIERELCWAAAVELYRVRPQRTALPWDVFRERFLAADGPEELARVLRAAIPDAADRFDLPRLDRPLTGRRFDTRDELDAWIRGHVRADIARSGDPDFSQDAAVFSALLGCHATLVGLAATDRLTARATAHDLTGWWMNIFSYLASGPPAPRLEELLALSEAGLVRFLGAGLEVELDEAARVFRARSQSLPTPVEARALVEARLPRPDVAATDDRLLVDLLRRGVGADLVVSDDKGYRWGAGRLHVDAQRRVVDVEGRAHPRLFAVGYWTAGGQVAAFARPGTNAPFFRQNDALARSLWSVVTGLPVTSIGTDRAA